MEKTIQEIYANRHNKLTGREIGRLYLAVSIDVFSRRGMPIMSVADVLPLVQTVTTPKDQHDLKRYFNLELVLRKFYRTFNDIYPNIACTLLQVLSKDAMLTNQIDIAYNLIKDDVKNITQACYELDKLDPIERKTADKVREYKRDVLEHIETLYNDYGSVYYGKYEDMVDKNIPFQLKYTGREELTIGNHINVLDNALRLLRLMVGYNHFVNIANEVFNVPQLKNALIIMAIPEQALESYNTVIDLINETRDRPLPGFYKFDYDEEIDIPQDVLEDFKRKLKKPRTLLKSELEIEELFLSLPFYWDFKNFQEEHKINNKARWNYKL